MPSSSTDQHPDHDRSQPLFTLAVLGTQAAPPLFYPYLRRYFGQRFWSLKRLAFLTAICFGAILMRVYFRSLTFIVVERLPANPHRWSPAYESDNWVGERFILSFLVFWFAATALAIGHRILAWRRSSQAGFPYIESQHPGYSRLWFLVRLPALQRLGFLQSYNGAEAFLEPPFLFVVGYALSFVLPEFGAFVVLGSLLLFWNEFSVWRAYHHRDLDAKDASSLAWSTSSACGRRWARSSRTWQRRSPWPALPRRLRTRLGKCPPRNPSSRPLIAPCWIRRSTRARARCLIFNRINRKETPCPFPPRFPCRP